MQSPEEFIRGYFEARIAEERREEANRAPFRRRFFAEDCLWGGHAGRLAMFLSEKVTSVSSSETQAEVITIRENLGIADQTFYLRYRLQTRDGRWQIFDAEVQCCACDGKAGNPSCPACHGTGWRSTRQSLQSTAGVACGMDAGMGRNRLIAVVRAPMAAVQRLWLRLHRRSRLVD